MAAGEVWIFLAVLTFGHLIDKNNAQRRICNRQADIAFLIDSSGSIIADDPRNWNRVLDFVVNIVDQLQIGPDQIRIAAATFSNTGIPQIYFRNTTTLDAARTAIRRIDFENGNTNTSGGLYIANNTLFREEAGDRPEVRNILVVIADGVSTRDKDLTVPYANSLKRRGIKIIAVGIGNEVDLNELKGIASPPDAQTTQTVYTVSDFRTLTSIIDKLVDETCILITTTTTTTTPAQITTPGIGRAPVCRETVDLVLVLDESGSVEEHNFEQIKVFCKNLVEQLDLEGGTVRVSLLTFSDLARIRFHLNRYTKRTDAITAISALRYERGTTNTAAALRALYTEMLTPQNGARSGSNQIAMLITDGSSNQPRDTLNEAREVKKRGIQMFVVTVGNWFNGPELNAIASYPYSRTRYQMRDFVDLNRNNFPAVSRALFCNDVDDCASNPCRNSRRCVDNPGYYSCVCLTGFGGPTCAERCRQPADVVFAIDASGSIGHDNFEKVVDFSREVVTGMLLDEDGQSTRSQVGLLTFSDEPQVVFNLDDYDNKNDVLNAFAPHYTGGGTNTARAIQTARTNMFVTQQGDQPNTRNILFVITDGKSQNETKTWEEARLAREAGITIIAIGIGGSVMERELNGIASTNMNDRNSTNVWLTPTFDNLASIRSQITSAICNAVDECLSNPCRNGGVCTEHIGYYTCRCPDRFTGANCDRSCSGRLDVIFALDTSGSIRSERFQMIKDFIKSIIRNLEVEAASKTRIGLLTWSDSAKIEFKLDYFKSVQDAVQSVEYLQYRGGRTNTYAALEMMRTEMFTAGSGDRQDTQNFVILITDGNSNVRQQDTVTAGIQMRLQGAHITTVSVGQLVNMLELEALASPDTAYNMLNVERYDQLAGLSNSIVQRLCNDINECASNPCRNGGRCVDGHGRYTCICASGFAGVTCNLACSRQLDVVFVLDMSGSTEVNHKRARLVAKEIVMNMDMSFGRARVGMVTYGDSAKVHFYLNTYTDKEETLNAMCFIPEGGRTNTAEALSTVQTQMFTTARGERPGVNNIIILVTDGYSNVRQGDTVPIARNIKNNGDSIYVVAIGDGADMAEVNAVAGSRNINGGVEYVYQLMADTDIPRIALELSRRLCQ